MKSGCNFGYFIVDKPIVDVISSFKRCTLAIYTSNITLTGIFPPQLCLPRTIRHATYSTVRSKVAIFMSSFDTSRIRTVLHLRSTCIFGPKLCGNLFYMKLYSVEKFTIGHVAVHRGRLNYITNARTRMCISLTDNVTWSIS